MRQEKFIYRLFRSGVFLKGVAGVAEMLGGFFLLFTSTRFFLAFATAITRSELAEEPQDFLAFHIIKIAQGISVDTKLFSAFYLLIHGIINITLALGLLKNKLWVFPVAMTTYITFLFYQIYRIIQTHSLLLVGVTLFDITILGLIYHQYFHLRKSRAVF